MATIADLNKSLSDMTEEELIERMREIRRSRRLPKKKAKTKSPSKPKKDIDVGATMKSMSPEARAKLIEQLEGLNET